MKKKKKKKDDEIKIVHELNTGWGGNRSGAGRPDEGLIHCSYRLMPETIAKIQELSIVLKISQGKVIDRVISMIEITEQQ